MKGLDVLPGKSYALQLIIIDLIASGDAAEIHWVHGIDHAKAQQVAYFVHHMGA